LGVRSHSSPCHSQFLSLQGVPIASVSILGLSLSNSTKRRTVSAGIRGMLLVFDRQRISSGCIPNRNSKSLTCMPVRLLYAFRASRLTIETCGVGPHRLAKPHVTRIGVLSLMPGH